MDNEKTLTNFSVGDIVKFGKYEQDISNGKEVIEWQVLAVEGNKVLIISKYCLDCIPYNDEYDEVTWETCTLRKWLNGTFLNDAFSKEEQKKIATTNLSTDKNPEFIEINPGNDTSDKIFLLSIEEVNEYFDDNDARKCAPTEYAENKDVPIDNNYHTANFEATCWWLLRSPGQHQGRAAHVCSDGDFYYDGDDVDSDNVCVRPAMWINLES